jgi:hypothetical protein
MTVKANQVRKDAGDSAFFARELELIKPQVYERQYPEMKHALAIPVSPDKDPAAEFITYRMYDKSGVAKFISSYADDLPRADIQGREFSVKVKRLGASAGYNIDELRAAEKLGRPIDKTKIMAASEITNRLIDEVAFLGDSALGLVGLCSIPNMPNTVVATSGGQVTWAGKIGLGTLAGIEAILADLNAPFTRMAIATKDIEIPDTVLMSPSSYRQIAQTRIPDTEVTILDFFLKAHQGVQVITCQWLETSGTGAAKQMIVYRRDLSKLSLEIPEDVNVMEPEVRNLETIVNVTAKFAGVQCKYPLSLDSSYGM